MPKVKIIKGDTLTTISVKKNVSTAALRALNPGVKTVKAGQVIKVPKNYDDDTPAPKFTPQVVKTTPTNIQSGGMLSPDKIVPGIPIRSGIMLPPTGYGAQQTIIPQQPAISQQSINYTGTAGYWGAYNQPNIQSGGMLSPDKIVPGIPIRSGIMLPPTSYGPQQTIIPQQPINYNQPNTQAGGQLSPDKVPITSQPFLGSSGYLNPAYQTPQNTQPATTVKLDNPRPINPDGTTPVFTGDPNDPNTAAWRAYWNNVAQLGGDPNIPAAAPTVMTREEIWQMKAASRRKKMAGMSKDELAGGGYAPYQYSEPTQSYIPEPLVRSITWGI